MNFWLEMKRKRERKKKNNQKLTTNDFIRVGQISRKVVHKMCLHTLLFSSRQLVVSIMEMNAQSRENDKKELVHNKWKGGGGGEMFTHSKTK